MMGMLQILRLPEDGFYPLSLQDSFGVVEGPVNGGEEADKDA